jgi:hypothetical protein
MAHSQDLAFERFVTQRKKDLQRIARHTQGEHQLPDVINEAWLVAFDLAARRGATIEFLNPAFQELLLSHLYQHLVRYTEQNVRLAVRLDHAPAGGDSQDASHPLMNMLVSDGGRDPLAELIERETESLWNNEPDVHHSLAGAYVRLLRHFDNRMRSVADHLLISVSHAYHRCAQARLWAIYQNPVPMPVMEGQFIPGPWRLFQLRRVPVQLMFDFDDELPLQWEPLTPKAEAPGE